MTLSAAGPDALQCLVAPKIRTNFDRNCEVCLRSVLSDWIEPLHEAVDRNVASSGPLTGCNDDSEVRSEFIGAPNRRTFDEQVRGLVVHLSVAAIADMTITGNAHTRRRRWFALTT